MDRPVVGHGRGGRCAAEDHDAAGSSFYKLGMVFVELPQGEGDIPPGEAGVRGDRANVESPTYERGEVPVSDSTEGEEVTGMLQVKDTLQPTLGKHFYRCAKAGCSLFQWETIPWDQQRWPWVLGSR